MLAVLIFIPIVGGLLAWAAGRNSLAAPRWISLMALALELAILVIYWLGVDEAVTPASLPATSGPWLLETQIPWIPQLGISIHLAMDGLSLLMLLLTAFIGITAVAASWTEIEERVGFFHFNLMWVIGGIVGVFVAMDLFLFYFFWEMMLIPMYFLIAVWGHENRVYAAVKFFLFTQISGLLMLMAADTILQELICQSLRELLLLQSSDWQFLISTVSARDYAELRFSTHYDWLKQLISITKEYLQTGGLSEGGRNFLSDCQQRDDLFPELDWRWFFEYNINGSQP